jgi:hypothetical protein
MNECLHDDWCKECDALTCEDCLSSSEGCGWCETGAPPAPSSDRTDPPSGRCMSKGR